MTTRPHKRKIRARHATALAVSAAAHAAILAAFLGSVPPAPADLPVQTPILVEMTPPARAPVALAPSKTPSSSASAAAVDDITAPRPSSPTVRPARPAPVRLALPAAVQPPLQPLRPSYALVGGVQLGGARTAGSGAGSVGAGSGTNGAGAGDGGGDCDMIGRLQAALRDDPDVRAAIDAAHREAAAGSRALLVWDGDWIQNPGQEGKGLAGLRQALSVEVAFSPRVCQAERLRGLVLLTLAEGPSAPKVVLGRAAWTWADLLDRRR